MRTLRKGKQIVLTRSLCFAVNIETCVEFLTKV